MKNILILFLATTFLWSCSSKKKKKAEATATKKETKAPKVEKKEKHWSYKGAHGPSHWGDINPEFGMCKTGQSQSPVNLVWTKPVPNGTLLLSYKPTHYSIIDNGHTIQVDFPAGLSSNIRGDRYELLQLHFHATSEHTISGKSFPAEIHFVHKNDKGQLAVIGVMVKEGEKNKFVDQLWGKIPSKKGQKLLDQMNPFNPADLMPKTKTYYNYTGSLTTPPCSEGVNWNVLNTPITMSQIQLAFFNTYYTKTNRPIQKLNARKTTNY